MAVTNLLPDNLFPSSIHGLLRTISRAGFFDRSVMIGSWVMLIYQELYGARYALRTLDVDFAVHIAHMRRQLRADLKQLITGLGFTDYLAAEGVQKFTGGGYEVEFIGQRSGGRNTGFLSVPEWNVTAIPLPFINILMDFSAVAEMDGFTIRFPIPEAYFLHKLIIARKRPSGAKRGKDLEQCTAIMQVINDERLLRHGIDAPPHIFRPPDAEDPAEKTGWSDASHYRWLNKLSFYVCTRIGAIGDGRPDFPVAVKKLWQWSPAAAEIFTYRRDNPEVSTMPWGFDRGGVSDDRRSTWASFSCVALSGWGKDEITVSASMNEDGSWRIKHAIINRKERL